MFFLIIIKFIRSKWPSRLHLGLIRPDEGSAEWLDVVSPPLNLSSYPFRGHLFADMGIRFYTVLWYALGICLRRTDVLPAAGYWRAIVMCGVGRPAGVVSISSSHLWLETERTEQNLYKRFCNWN